MRHELVEYLTAARANRAPVQLFTKIGDQRQHAAAIAVGEMRQRRAGIILLQRVLPQFAPVLFKLFIRRLGFIVADQFIKHAPHVGHLLRQPRAERIPVGSPHPPGQPGAIKFILRQGLRLLVVDALQQVFQATQKQIGFAQPLRIPFRQQVQLFDGGQRRQQSPLLQHRFASAANQLEDLDDKLHFADAARAELDVVLQSPTAHLTGDHSLHVTQRLNHAEINIAAEDKRPQHGAQLAGVNAIVIAHDSRFHHRVALPVAPLLLVIILQRGKAQHQRAAVAKRAQAHINAVDKAILGGLIQHLNQALPEAGKKLGVVQLATAAARGAMLRPGENQIDVGGEIQLAAAELAHPEDQQRLRRTFSITRSAPFTAAGGV